MTARRFPRVRWSVEDVVWTRKGRVHTGSNPVLCLRATIRPEGRQWKASLRETQPGGSSLGSCLFPTLLRARLEAQRWLGGRLRV